MVSYHIYTVLFDQQPVSTYTHRTKRCIRQTRNLSQFSPSTQHDWPKIWQEHLLYQLLISISRQIAPLFFCVPNYYHGGWNSKKVEALNVGRPKQEANLLWFTMYSLHFHKSILLSLTNKGIIMENEQWQQWFICINIFFSDVFWPCIIKASIIHHTRPSSGRNLEIVLETMMLNKSHQTAYCNDKFVLAKAYRILSILTHPASHVTPSAKISFTSSNTCIFQELMSSPHLRRLEKTQKENLHNPSLQILE